MKNRLNRLLYGKNSKPLYFVRNVVRYLTPKRLTQARLAGVLAELERRPDREYILDRVDYYCKLTPGAAGGKEE